MPQNNLPEMENKNARQTDRAAKFEQMVLKFGERAETVGVGSVGSDPLVSIGMGLLSRGLFSGISKIGNIIPSLSRKNSKKGEVVNHQLKVDGKIQIESSGERSIERLQSSPDDQQSETDSKKEASEKSDNKEKKKTEKESISRLEKVLTSTSKQIDEKSTTASVLVGTLFGGDQLTGLALGGLTKLASMGARGVTNKASGALERRRLARDKDKKKESAKKKRQGKSATSTTKQLDEKSETSSNKQLDEKIASSSSIINRLKNVLTSSNKQLDEKIASSSTKQIDEKSETSSIINRLKNVLTSSNKQLDEKSETSSTKQIDEKIASSSNKQLDEKSETSSIINRLKNVLTSSNKQLDEKSETSSTKQIDEKIASSSNKQSDENNTSSSTKQSDENNTSSSIINRLKNVLTSSNKQLDEKSETSSTKQSDENNTSSSIINRLKNVLTSSTKQSDENNTSSSTGGGVLERMGFSRDKDKKKEIVEKSPREEVREKIVENRQTKALRSRMQTNDADVTAAAATAAIQKMESPSERQFDLLGEKVVGVDQAIQRLSPKLDPLDDLNSMKKTVERISDALTAGLPTAQDKAEDKLERRRAKMRAKEEKELLEQISDNTTKEKEGGMLSSIFEGIGSLFSGGAGILGGFGIGAFLKGKMTAFTGSIGQIFTKTIPRMMTTFIGFIGRIFTKTIPRFLMGAIKKIPFITFGVSIFKGLFDGVASLMRGEGIMTAVFSVIEGFADSLVRLFSFGLLNIDKLREWMQPAMDVIFDTVHGLINFTRDAFSRMGELISGIPSMITELISNAVGSIPGGERLMNFLRGDQVSEETIRTQTARSQEIAEQSRIVSTLEMGVEQGRPISPERRQQLEERLETIRGQEQVNQIQPAVPLGSRVLESSPLPEGGRPSPDARSADTVSFLRESPALEMVSNQTEPQLERERMADAFEADSVTVELEGILEQIRGAKATQNQVNNVIQNNSQSSTITTPRGNLRKDDYFAGANNREVDF